MATKSSRRNCIFCRKIPQSKNHEHIIPQWLIKLTGRPTRMGIFALKGMRRTSFSFQNFVFPACSKCNEAYSQLESNAKGCMESLLSTSTLNAEQAACLLDWVDKVRVGLWLGGIMLNQNPYKINPRFAINERVGKRDRMIFLCRSKSAPDGINFFPIYDPGFAHLPSFTSIRINNVCMVSLSHSFVCAKSLGLYYLEEVDATLESETPKISARLSDANEAHYGKHFPTKNPQFSTLAQSILDSDCIGLSFEDEAKLMEGRDEQTRKSAIHLFKKGAGTRLNSTNVDLFVEPFDSLDSMMAATNALAFEIRAWLLKKVPPPRPGTPFTMVHLVAMIEKLLPQSSLLLKDKLEGIGKSLMARLASSDDDPELILMEEVTSALKQLKQDVSPEL